AMWVMGPISHHAKGLPMHTRGNNPVVVHDGTVPRWPVKAFYADSMPVPGQHQILVHLHV
ncbi:hypothetical protein HAX54_051464, partial [Datura stramonium]|nr:hypothetical protein [Datura stramonium]